MALDTDTPTEPAAEEAVPQGPANSIEKLYRFSTWLHVGPGAEECEDAENGSCGDPMHLHGWCRLPNQFQHREIREKALAAKARRVRQLRSPDTDGSVILEEELDQLARLPKAHPDLVDELLAQDWWKDYLDAVEEVKADLDDESEPVWEHIDDDQERFRELAAMDEEDRPADEWTELETRLMAYNAAIEEKVEEARKPKREALEAKDINALIDLVRDQRIEADAMEAFMHTYAIWQWVSCTRRTPNGVVLWSDVGELRDATTEVLEGLKDTYEDLERTSREAANQGNS